MTDVEKLIAELKQPLPMIGGYNGPYPDEDYIYDLRGRTADALAALGSQNKDLGDLIHKRGNDIAYLRHQNKKLAKELDALQAENSEMKAAFDAQERDASLADGNLWRFWSRKAREVAKENERLRWEAKCLGETLDAWFDRRKLGHDAVDQAVVDAASGYLRTSRVGGMSNEESDMILDVIQDMARLGLFADLFARAALKGDAP